MFGNQPYPILSNQEVFHFVTSGGRLDKPENCHIEMLAMHDFTFHLNYHLTLRYNLMLNCWEMTVQALMRVYISTDSGYLKNSF